MGIEAKERRIGPELYRVSQLGTKAGLSMLVRLTKIAGPGVGSFVHGLGRDASGVDSAIAHGVGEALHDLAARLDEQEVQRIMNEFAERTVVVVSREVEVKLSDIFDDHFAGRYHLLLEWARFCMEVNFSSFFSAASGKGPLARLWKMVSAFQSQAPSPGTSTESPAASDTPQA